MKDKTIWGVQGGDLARQRVQTHLAVGSRFGRFCGFYFTIAFRVVGRWLRLRLFTRKPFVEVRYGRMS